MWNDPAGIRLLVERLGLRPWLSGRTYRKGKNGLAGLAAAEAPEADQGLRPHPGILILERGKEGIQRQLVETFPIVCQRSQGGLANGGVIEQLEQDRIRGRPQDLLQGVDRGDPAVERRLGIGRQA